MINYRNRTGDNYTRGILSYEVKEMSKNGLADSDKFTVLKTSPITTLAFLGKVCSHMQNENDPFIEENADILNSPSFQQLVQSALTAGIHALRIVQEQGLYDGRQFKEKNPEVEDNG